MRKVDRLFEIIQLLRGKRLRTAEFIAGELGVSQRTIYRDIAGLMASGVPIEGERGVGYLINQPIEIPPLHFLPLELKALQMGADLVKAVADHELAQAAEEAAIKIADALPGERMHIRVNSAANIRVWNEEDTKQTLGTVRNAIDKREKVKLDYRDKSEKVSSRIIWPLGLEYWGRVWTVSAWCEKRVAFRSFRIDQIVSCDLVYENFPHEPGKTYQDFVKYAQARDKVSGYVRS